jgi:hypothetical protein
MADYTSDPTISAFDVPENLTAPKISPMSGRRPDLQPEEEFSPYSLDPTINAFDPIQAIGNMMNPEPVTAPQPQGNPYVAEMLKRMFQLRQGAQATSISALDLPLGLPAQIAGGLTYGGARLGGTSPERAQELSEYASTPLSYLQPGKLGSLKESPIAQGSKAYELSPITQIMGLVDKYGAQPAINYLINQGMSPQDAQQLVTNAPLLVAPGFKLGKIGVETARKLPGYAEELRPTETARIEPTMDGVQPQSVGAAQATPAAMLRGNVEAALTNASPELQSHIKSQPLENVNLPALETKSLEEKHGVNLTAGQRTGDLNRYVDEWNARGKTNTLSNHFADQPKQLADAFENAKIKHAPDIPSTADASELGQHQINALASKDKLRTDAIKDAYQKLTDANGGQFPIDIQTLDSGIKSELSKNLKTNHLPTSIASDLSDFYKNPTFEAYEALRTNSANEMRSNSNPNARAAVWILRNELEKLPVFGEKNAAFDPRAAELKQMADTARSLVAERYQVLNNNPAYKAAVKEYGSLQDAASQGESLNAANFHKKFVSNATPEAIRRMKAEISADDIANQAITFAELDRAKNNQVNANATNVKTDRFADFLRKESPRLKAAISPEAMQDVSELGLLSSKIGKPQAGVFNHSNSFNAYLRELATQGLITAGEAKLATATAGASVPFTMAGKQWMMSRGHENFAKQATDPFGGLTKEK